MSGKKQRARKVQVWISYDLSVGKDYDNLYKWLKSYEAFECGNSTACLFFSKERGKKFIPSLKREIEEYINIEEGDRMYIWYKGHKGVLCSQWIYGDTKVVAPWSKAATLD